MERAISGVDAGTEITRVRFNVRGAGTLTDPGIGPRRRGRHAELQQREDEQRNATPQGPFRHCCHNKTLDSALTA